ncbi:hypothetical protein QZM46_08090 [Burkholderia vietnamiensis]|uniref:Uncharacterized protein n=1 Tax=Burkholderia vietnamiensis TaxID=60552 RepID=A0AAW7T2Q8_BURVI|nr:hypothetical protein [Burkholderia vietnamiensis]MDN7551294.1 hypothetical protein [Burkholderia vietnamiensis]MDN7795108.1 hypothetical protein [Burkholderia vietnamiensis]MDN8043620.1 hypothetical protein [Burkholderia vietnamiensis]MDN8073755.1 hypothetical protein [Burkholderia vietnamiensis]
MLDFEGLRRKVLSQLSNPTIALKQLRFRSIDVVGQRGRGRFHEDSLRLPTARKRQLTMVCSALGGCAESTDYRQSKLSSDNDR